MNETPSRAPAPAPPSRRQTFGCLALIAVPFGLGGLALIASALPRLGTDAETAAVQVFVGVFLLLAGFVLSLMFVPLMRGRSPRRTLREAHPTEPWRWREDWAAGMVEARPMGLGAFQALARFHDVRLTLAVTPIAIGRECAGRIEIAEGAAHLDFDRPLSCVLICVHRRTTGQSRNASEIEFWRDEQTVRLEPHGRGARAAWKVGIPADRPATSLGPMDDRVRWDLRIRQAIAGADLDFTFELPVFAVDDATFAAQAGPGLAAALAVTPALAPEPPSPSSGVQVTPEGDSVRVTVAAGRHAGFATLLLGLALIFASVAGVQLYSGAWAVALVAAVLMVPMLYGVLRIRYRQVEVVATPDRLEVRTTFLGRSRRREVAASALRELRMVVGMTVGPTPYWDVRAVSLTGVSLTLVPSMVDEAAAKYVTAALAAVLQVPVAPPDRHQGSGSRPHRRPSRTAASV